MRRNMDHWNRTSKYYVSVCLTTLLAWYIMHDAIRPLAYAYSAYYTVKMIKKYKKAFNVQCIIYCSGPFCRESVWLHLLYRL